jgi:hypothetical protein
MVQAVGEWVLANIRPPGSLRPESPCIKSRGRKKLTLSRSAMAIIRS